MSKAQYDPEASMRWHQMSQEVFGPRLKSIRDKQPIQDGDNQANLYFYDNKRQLAFHWDGNRSHVVEVAYGGDHEPMSWYFDYETVRALVSADRRIGAIEGTAYQTVIAEFQAACETWIDFQETAR